MFMTCVTFAPFYKRCSNERYVTVCTGWWIFTDLFKQIKYLLKYRNKMNQTEARPRKIPTLELPDFQDFTIVGTGTYLADKKKRPLSLSSIKDLRIVPKKEPPKEDEKKRLRSLMLASTALAKFRSHASIKRKDKRVQPSSVKSALSSYLPLPANGSRLSMLEFGDVFDGQICRRYAFSYDISIILYNYLYKWVGVSCLNEFMEYR